LTVGSRAIEHGSDADLGNTSDGLGRFDYAAIGTVSNVASRLCDEVEARANPD
jgi:class 3 adenylate cyclase